MKTLAALAMLAAVPAAAQFDLSAASPAALQAAMSEFAVPTPAASAVAFKEGKSCSAPTVRLEGRLHGRADADILRYSDEDRHDDMVWLDLNNDKDRVAGRVRVCSERNGGDEPDSCDDVTFVFPQLTVDRAAKVIKHGDDVVATIGGFWKGIRVANGWKLRAERRVEESVKDDGFNRKRDRVVRVLLVLEK